MSDANLFGGWFDDSKTDPYKNTGTLPPLPPEKQRKLDARIDEIFKRLIAEEFADEQSQSD